MAASGLSCSRLAVDLRTQQRNRRNVITYPTRRAQTVVRLLTKASATAEDVASGGMGSNHRENGVSGFRIQDTGPREKRVSTLTVEDIKKCRLITAIKTPYNTDGSIDIPAFDKMMEAQIAAGVEGVVVGGTTGEGHLMSWDEHIMIIAHTVAVFGDRILVLGNTGSNATREAVHATSQGFAVGMHASLQVNPYYGKTSKRGLTQHFEQAMSFGPAIIYNVPSRTNQDVGPDIIEPLSKHPYFLGVKECAGDDRIKYYADKGIATWSGNDDQCHKSRYESGATGVISVTSNIAPSLMHSLMFGGHDESLNQSLLPIMEWLFEEPNPIGVNTALSMLGMMKPVFRLPYVPYDLEMRRKGLEILQRLGLENVVGAGHLSLMDDSDFLLVGKY